MNQNDVNTNTRINNNIEDNSNKYNNYKGNKTKDGLKKIIIAILCIGLVLIFFIVLIKNKSNDAKVGNELDSNVIVIENDGGLYAIYSSDGNKISDFKYNYISEFLNNTAIVKNSKGLAGVINNKGKMIINFGKYKSISREGYLYKVTTNNYEEYILNSEGKILYNLKDNRVNSYTNPQEIVIMELKNEIDVLDYEGNSLLKLNGNDDYEIYEGEENYATLFYKNISYIIDLYNKKAVYKKDSSMPYCVKSINSFNSKEYVISNCKKSDEFQYMNGSTEVFTKRDCTNLFFEHDNNNLICASGNQRYIVDKNGNNKIEIYSSNSHIKYIDELNYIDSDNNSTNFYNNGKLIKKVKCTEPYSTASRDKGIYILKNTCSSNYSTLTYYDRYGKQIFKDNFEKTNVFDKNNNAVVSMDGKNYYIININGNKISDYYDNIEYVENSNTNSIYRARKANKNFILNKKGKQILSLKGSISIYNNYFTDTTDDTVSYYTFNGKKFFE